MRDSLEQIQREALALPANERAQLVEKLWESLGDTTCPHLSEEWKEDIDRRCLEIDEGKARMTPGEDVMRETREMLQALRRK